jgi:HD-GYP domain-containing protein (c-di-GMP phosphodiesterase class II)
MSPKSKLKKTYIGRIVAVADVFGASISKRYYKDAFSVEESMKIIEDGSGTDFEVSLVEAFKNALPQIFRVTPPLNL